MALTQAAQLNPPFYDAPIVDYASGQQHSQAWTEYHQMVADRLSGMRTGVTNGSDAVAGDIGEFMSATVDWPGASISNNVPANVTSLALTAGDWDVRGEVWFRLGAGPTGNCEAAISPASASLPDGLVWVGARATHNFLHTANSPQVLALSPCRFSLSAAATVYLVALSGFSGGSNAAFGRIEARRIR